MAKKDKEMAVTTGKVEREPDENTWTPLVDIYEAEDGTTVVTAEMPGAIEKDIDIRVDKGVLTIAGPIDLGRFGEGYSQTYTGFSGGSYFRAFALSDEIDREGIAASFEDGVLTLRLPRAAAAQTRKIEIQG